MVKLSIIIPFFNVQNYTDELLEYLRPQITNEVEVLVIDDGSEVPFHTDHKWVRVFHKENGGVSTARNMGINESKGEYISFVDADDLVAADYIKQILEKIDTEHFDYLEMSWNSLPGGAQWSQKLNSIEDSLPNPSACTRVFKRSCIGDIRFNEKKFTTEDEDFKRRLYFTLKDKKKAVITDYLYHYRTSVENSKSKRFMNGEMTTKRIVYYFKHITKDMRYLVDEIAKEDEYNEVIVLTEQNDIPELEYYCRVKKPQNIKGMELRGEPFKGFTQIRQAYRAQVILYISRLNEINGISTWIYNFCQNMKDKKDIIVCYDEMDNRQLFRLIPLVQCEKITGRKFICDNLVMCSIKDQIPTNISYKKSIQVIHSCKRNFALPSGRDVYVNVSKVSKDSFGNEGLIIPNMTFVQDKELLLISTTRIGAADKGDNDKRMIKFAKYLDDNLIKYTWLYFSESELKNASLNLVHMKPTLNIQNWIRRADILINLSDKEGFCYSIVEALSLGIPCITTDLEVLPEIGFMDGINGHKIPFEFTASDVVKAISKPLKFKYEYDNDRIMDQWLDILGHRQPIGQYRFDDSQKAVMVVKEYKDMDLHRPTKLGEILLVSAERAKMLRSKELVDILY